MIGADEIFSRMRRVGLTDSWTYWIQTQSFVRAATRQWSSAPGEGRCFGDAQTMDLCAARERLRRSKGVELPPSLEG